jgi:pyruvate dehydrogenase E2 component (dihydrolipoamide acetyltransferase)
MTTIEIKVPDIGDFNEVEVIEVMVKAGDTIKVDQSLLTVESDKASMEIPSSHAGVVKEVKIKVGDKVAEGSVILLMEASEATSAPTSATPEKSIAEQPDTKKTEAVKEDRANASPAQPSDLKNTEVAKEPTSSTSNNKSHASPSIRKYARELGVDLSRVIGSGTKSRITISDVQSFVKGVMQAPAGASTTTNGSGFNVLAWPSLDFSKFGATETVPLSRIKKLSGPNLHRNWVMIPHVTQFDEADITDLEDFRKSSNEALAKSGVKLTMLAFVIKASVAALKKFSAFNSSLDAAGENIIVKQYFNIGFAADTPNGLVVPVIKNADQKSLSQIATEMGELSGQAREGKLKPTDMQGATFTISSLGGIGGTAFTPIINAPEVAILGLSKSSMKPIWDGTQFEPRLMLPLSLSYDHRVIDGAMAARFTAYLADVLTDLRKTLL